MNSQCNENPTTYHMHMHILYRFIPYATKDKSMKKLNRNETITPHNQMRLISRTKLFAYITIQTKIKPTQSWQQHNIITK